MIKTLAALAAEYAELTWRKKKLEASLTVVKKQLKDAEKVFHARMVQDSVPLIRVTGEWGIATCYAKCMVYASCPDPEKLRGTPFEELIKETVNGNSLSAQVRELPRDKNMMPIMPEEVEPGAITVSEVFSVNVLFS